MANTRYIASYDTERPACLAGCRKIVDIHRRYEMPATFFITGETLDANPREYRELLDDPLFEIASHTWSHRMLRDNPWCGPAVSLPDIEVEVFRGKQKIEDVFERPCVGLRPGCSFVDGLRGAPEVLKLVDEAGYQYVSSQAWGPDYTLPAPLAQPYTYEADGHARLWELPCHGWHENMLKDHNRLGPRRLVLWPAPMPEAVPDGFLKTPQEEFALNRIFIERAAEESLAFVSLIWHPWSLDRFDAPMKMLELTFSLVREMKLETCTYADFRRALAG